MLKNYSLHQRVAPWCRLALAALLSSGSYAAQAFDGPHTAAHPAPAARPLAANDAAVNAIYTFGRIASPKALPHAVQAVVTNAGTAALTNLPVTLSVTGANTFTNVQTVASLAAGASTTVTFAAYPATLALGTNNLAVTVPADDDVSNNSSTFVQRVTGARVSYIDTTAAFNSAGATVGSAGGALAVKYTLGSAANYLASATVTFVATTAASTSYQVLIYDATGTGGTPGNAIFTSTTRTHTAAASSATIALPSLQVGSSFFVAVKEIDNGLGVATQPEVPLRPNTFYFQTSGGAWTATSSQTRRAIDITLGSAPACPMPVNISATNITDTGASVVFTGPSNGTAYTFIYGPKNFNPATAGTTINTTTSPVTLTGLTANTSYDVYITATCGTSGTSFQAGPINFTTACKIITFPYTENFDGVTAPALPCGITVLNANNDASTWVNTAANPNSSPNAMRYTYSLTNPADDWFFLPIMNLQQGMSYQIQFKYRSYSSTSFPEGLEVKAGTAATPAGQTTTLFSNSAIQTATYVTTTAGNGAGQVALFTPTASGQYYFGFHANSTANQFYLYVDDISITAVPTPACLPPSTPTISAITTSGATVAFTGPANGSAYSVIYGPTGFNPATAGTTVNGTTSPVVLTGLTANSNYCVYVRATCGTNGNSTLVGPVCFATACATVSTFPYNENFDSVTAPALPCGITILNANNDGSTWVNTAANPSSSPNAMRYSYNSSNAANDWFFTTGLNMVAGRSYQLQFKYRSYSATSFPEALEVKVGTGTTAATQTTTVFSNTNILLANYVTTTAGNGAGQVALFTPTTSGTYYFGFHAISTADQFYLYVDDVNVVDMVTPACLPPSTPTISGITTSGATVTFTGPANGSAYTVIYGPSGFNPATAGTPVNGTVSPITLTGLASSTTYDVYLRATCGTNGNSTLVGPVTFATACQGASAVPYTQNFDGVTAPALPCGITVLDANSDGSTWANMANNPNSSPNAMRYTYNSNNAANDWFFTNGLALQAGGTYQLQFKYRVNSATFPEALEVKVGTGTTPATQTTTVFSNTNLTNITYTTTTAGTAAGQVMSFTPTTSGTYYFGFHAISDVDQFYLYVDDVNVTVTGLAACPNPTNFTATNVTSNSATISFTGPAAGTAYTVIYGAPGFNPATAGTSINTTTSPITLTGLTPSTAYQVYVRATCGTNGNSLIVGPVSFSTACLPVTSYPYLENFDGVVAPALPCGVTVLDNNSDGNMWTTVATAPSSSPNAMRYNGGPSAADDWFFTNALPMQKGKMYQLQFKYRSSTYAERMEVRVGTGTTPATQTGQLFLNTNITNTTYTTTTSGTGTGQVVSFTPFVSGTYYIGFHAISSAQALYIYVDDISVTEANATATMSSVAAGFRAEASPVPFSDHLSVSLNTLAAGALQLTLHDALGRVVRETSTTVPAGASSLSVPDASTLPAGIYLLTVRQGSNTQVIRVAHE